MSSISESSSSDLLLLKSMGAFCGLADLFGEEGGDEVGERRWGAAATLGDVGGLAGVTSLTVSFGAELASVIAAIAAACWATTAAVATLSISALCSAMRSSSGRPLTAPWACWACWAAANRGLARAICHRWEWAKSGLSKACLWKGKLWMPGIDIKGKVWGNPEYMGDKEAAREVAGASDAVGNFNVGGEADKGGWGNNDANGDVNDEVLGTMVGEWCK